MNTKFSRRVLGLLLAMVMLAGILPQSAFAQQAQDSDTKVSADGQSVELTEQTVADSSNQSPSHDSPGIRQEHPKIPVTLTGQMEGGFIMAPETKVELEPGLAAAYGYTYGDAVTERDVTALDALVAMHQIVLGEEDITVFLEVNEFGWITRAFGEEGIPVGFMINGETPMTTCNETILHPNDSFLFFNYQDTAGYSDMAVWLEQEGKKQTQFDVEPGKPLELTIKSKDYSGNVFPVSGVELATVDENGGIEPLAGTVSDDTGKVSVTFDQPGDYTLTVLSSETTKVIMPIVHVAVGKPAVTPEASYSVTAADIENGQITLPAEKISAGQSVTITVTADLGYVLAKLTVTDAKGTEITTTPGKGGQFTFIMPASDVQVQAQMRKLSMELPDYQTILDETGKNLASRPNGFGGEWVAMGLARHGYPVDKDYFENYYKDVERQVIEKKGVLSDRKYTEYSRTILALAAAGYDVTNVGGYDLTAPLGDLEKVNLQGINGTIFALLALNSRGYEISDLTRAKTIREKLVAEILGKYLPAGGWSIFGNQPDVDTTAMAIQALAPHYSSNAQVKEAVNRALEWLSQTQGTDGNWANQDGAVCSETSAQVLVALTAMGINPVTDARFIKNGRTVIHGIGDFYLGDGSFSHIADSGANGIATEQSYYALVSYLRFSQGKTSLYDMTDVTIAGQAPEESEPEVTEPKPTESEATEPEATEPKPTEPEETKPGEAKPTQPGKPQNPGKSPNTGDEAPVQLLVFAVAASAVGVALLLKKRENSRV